MPLLVVAKGHISGIDFIFDAVVVIKPFAAFRGGKSEGSAPLNSPKAMQDGIVTIFMGKCLQFRFICVILNQF